MAQTFIIVVFSKIHFYIRILLPIMFKGLQAKKIGKKEKMAGLNIKSVLRLKVKKVFVLISRFQFEDLLASQSGQF